MDGEWFGEWTAGKWKANRRRIGGEGMANGQKRRGTEGEGKVNGL